jgi:hypothetical protein
MDMGSFRFRAVAPDGTAFTQDDVDQRLGG